VFIAVAYYFYFALTEKYLVMNLI